MTLIPLAFFIPSLPNLTFLISFSISFFWDPLLRNQDFIWDLQFLKSFSSEHNQLILNVWPKRTERLVCSGCEEPWCRYWWRSVDLICNAVFKFWSDMVIMRSRNEILFSLHSCVNVRLEVKLLNPSINLFNSSFPWVQMKNISSMNLSYNNGVNSCVSKKSCWTISM